LQEKLSMGYSFFFFFHFVQPPQQAESNKLSDPR
jgi:hypothetical protein